MQKTDGPSSGIGFANFTVAMDKTYPFWEALYAVTSKYGWLISVIIGVPGNFVALLVSLLQHNRRLSPSVYIACMAVADNIVLLINTYHYQFFAFGYGDDIIEERELIFR